LKILIEPHYLPSLAYFTALQPAKVVILEKCEYYVKQTFRNRCQILTTGGQENLIIPLTSKHGKVFITDIRIDYSHKWLLKHWRAIQSAYGKAPFFEYYSDDLKKILFKKEVFLYDLNYELLSICLRWLKWDMTIRESITFEKAPPLEVLDLRSTINLKKNQNVQYFYQPVSYHQVFGNTFVANLSIIDLIFCEGPNAAQIVKASAVTKMNK
jgi:hypothetical protein